MTQDKPTLNAIAQAYSMTRQNLHHLMKRHGFTHTDMLDPGGVFDRLLWGYGSPLRSRLSSPQVRGHIVRKLQNP